MNTGKDETIGIFGVGTKRAVVALAQKIAIKTRETGKTYQIEFDDAWIDAGEDWFLPVYEVDDIAKGNTNIQLGNLRRPITDTTETELTNHLGSTYSKFLKKKVSISINGTRVLPIQFNQWAYPPKFEPRHYKGTFRSTGGELVRVEAFAGLTLISSPAGGEYGVYFYCNDRLVARALKTHDVGFSKGVAGKPHADISLARLIVFINGEARLMPWNSSKSDINSSHEIFSALRPWLLQTVKDYTSLARRMSKIEGGWPKNVFKYKKGKIKNVSIPNFPQINTSYLPPLPKVQPRYSTTVASANSKVAQRKPWTTGLYESIIAVDWMLKQNFDQKNRMALMFLDSTLEIAFKEFLVNEAAQPIGNARIQRLFENRLLVHAEVQKYSTISATTWSKVTHYYNMRSLLTHQKATATVSDTDIQDFRKTVERVLSKLFGLKFG